MISGFTPVASPVPTSLLKLPDVRYHGAQLSRQPEMVTNIVDPNCYLKDAQDITPMALAYQAVELQTENRSKVLKQVLTNAVSDAARTLSTLTFKNAVSTAPRLQHHLRIFLCHS